MNFASFSSLLRHRAAEGAAGDRCRDKREEEHQADAEGHRPVADTAAEEDAHGVDRVAERVDRRHRTS